jgi:hypothetical protein
MLKPGIYTAVVRDANDDAGVALVEVYDADEAPSGTHLVNISTRAYAQTGDQVMIAGFVIEGLERREVLIRGVGPSLPDIVPDRIIDPTLELHHQKQPEDTDEILATNDNWGSGLEGDTLSIESAALRAGASKWARDSRDAALLIKLDPGIYTAILRGKKGATGNALIEVYAVPEAN